MASYTNVANLLKRIDPTTLGQLSDDVNRAADYTTTAATAIINQAIADASSLIDSYVLGHIDLTDSANTADLEFHCAVLALYYLHARKYLNDSENPKASQMRHTMSWLRNLREGELHTQAGVPSSTMLTTTSSTDKKFSDDTMGGFID